MSDLFSPVDQARGARERALELLYEAEAKGIEPAKVVAQLVIAPDPLAVLLVDGVGSNLERIDPVISQLSRQWSIDRMPWVDRNILRMGVWELHGRPEISTAVAINEAVELAKRFSTDDAPRFVNGVLSAEAKRARDDTDGVVEPW